MIHLIWSKDNNTSTSEDGKELKGVRSRLLECYRSLYFDPLADQEMSAKDQVNRIAKNMIECVRFCSFILMSQPLLNPLFLFASILFWSVPRGIIHRV